MAAIAGPTPPIEDPPEHLQGDGPGDVEMYAKLRERWPERLLVLEDDVLMRFVRGYATEEKREEVTFERVEGFLNAIDTWNLQNILNDPFEEFDMCSRAWEIFVYGQNKFGHPIVYDKVGCSAVSEMRRVFLDNVPETRIKHYRYRVQNQIARAKKALRLKYDKTIYKHVLIFDLAGFTTSHFSGSDIRNLVKETITEEQHLFPETLHKLYIINSPFVFRAAWSVISYFVDPLTYEKIKVLGSGYLSELRKEIADDQIPRDYGGSGPHDIRLGRMHTDELNDILARHAAETSGATAAADAETASPPDAATEGAAAS